VVDKKRINLKHGRAEEEERHKGSLTKKIILVNRVVHKEELENMEG
jgi:hypothetical protein